MVLLAVLASGVVGLGQTTVTPRVAEGALLFDNETGAEVVRLGILFDGPITICANDVIAFGGETATRLDVGLRTAWIDIAVEPGGTLIINVSGGAQVRSAYWVASTREKSRVFAEWILETIWNDQDLAGLPDFVAPEFVFHDVPLYGDIPGIGGYTMFAEGNLAAFPDTVFTVENVIAENDLVALQLTRRGTHLGDLSGIPPTGNSMTERCLVIYRLRDGRAIEGWMQYGALGMLVQLGVMPPMGPPNFTWGTPSAVIGDPGAPEENKLIASRDAFEIWSEGNLESIGEVIGEGFVGHFETATVDGTNAYTDYVSGMLGAFPDYQVTIEEIFADGDLVVFRSTVSGTHLGPFGPVPATGMPWTVGGIAVLRIADGKVVETWQLNDRLSLLVQIGLVPPLQ